MDGNELLTKLILEDYELAASPTLWKNPFTNACT